MMKRDRGGFENAGEGCKVSKKKVVLFKSGCC